jgi:hypothetical protein
MGLLGKDKELATAAAQGNLELVMEYAQFWGNPKFNHSEALRRAAMEGHTEVVAFLIPLSDPNAERGFALKTASVRGYTQCVRLLLECTDLNARSDDSMTVGTHALYCAARKGYYDTVDLIFEHISNEDVFKVLDNLDLTDEVEYRTYLQDKLTARTQRAVLEHQIASTLGTLVPRKM